MLYVLERRQVSALDAATGRVRWTTKFTASVPEPSSIGARGGQLVVGFDCPTRPGDSAFARHCGKGETTVGLGLEPRTGKVTWTLAQPQASNVGMGEVHSNFVTWGFSYTTANNPGAGGAVAVLPLPARQARFTREELRSFEMTSDEDLRPQFWVENRVYIVGDSETRRPTLNTNGELELEVLELPALTKAMVGLPVNPRVGCGAPEVTDVPREVPPLLTARLSDACGEFARRWLLERTPTAFPNPLLSSQASVFNSQGTWWAVDDDWLLKAATGERALRLPRAAHVQFVNPDVLLSWIGDAPRELEVQRLSNAQRIGTLRLEPNETLYAPGAVGIVGHTLYTLLKGRLQLYALPKP